MHNYILCGMQFGDEGKGSFIDFLADKYDADLVIRYNGGSQASHTVTTPAGIKHKFSQLGSGTFNRKTRTYLSSNTIVNIDNLFTEIYKFARKARRTENSIVSNLFISPEALVVTPYHKLLNELREISQGANRRGSVGTGVSEVRVLDRISNNPNSLVHEEYGWLAIRVKDIFDVKPDHRPDLDYLVGRFLAIRNFVFDFYERKKCVIDDNMPQLLQADINKEIEFLFKEGRAEELAKGYYQKAKKALEDYVWLRNNICTLEEVHQRRIDSIEGGDYIPYAVYQKIRDNYVVIYEGSQGLLLDRRYGIRPNTTCIDTSIQHALYDVRKTNEFLLEKIGAPWEEDYFGFNPAMDVHNHKIGIAKAIYSRHGIGPLPTADEYLDEHLEDKNQNISFWNGAIRFGWFDAVLFRYAQKINKVSEVYLSCIDMLNGLEEVRVCNSYLYKGCIDESFCALFHYYIDSDKNVIVTDIKKSSRSIAKYFDDFEPIYIRVNGWKRAVINSYYDHYTFLDANCENYISLLSALIGVPITLVSYGPTREEKLFR